MQKISRHYVNDNQQSQRHRSITALSYLLSVMESKKKIPDDIQGVPPGYTLCQDDGGSCFVVPQFLVPAGHTCFDTYRGKTSLENDIIPEVFVILLFIHHFVSFY